MEKKKKKEHSNPVMEKKPRKAKLHRHNNSCRAETL